MFLLPQTVSRSERLEVEKKLTKSSFAFRIPSAETDVGKSTKSSCFIRCLTVSQAGVCSTCTKPHVELNPPGFAEISESEKAEGYGQNLLTQMLLLQNRNHGYNTSVW